MAENSKIEWTHHTFNPWRGCTKVSAGCAHCYADAQAKRNPSVLGIWGKDGERVIAAESYWKMPYRWNAEAIAVGERRRVFCASMADVFEGEDTMPAASRQPVDDARKRLFDLIYETPGLDWLLLTKRPENALDMIGGKSGAGLVALVDTFPNLWIGTSAENQETFDQRVEHLRKIPAAVRFLSCEPLLGPIDPTPPQQRGTNVNVDDWLQDLDWFIVGGESGTKARPMQPAWARQLRDRCADRTDMGRPWPLPFFFKQWGEWLPYEQDAQPPFWVSAADGSTIDGHQLPTDLGDCEPVDGWYCPDLLNDAIFRHVGKHAAGRLLDGVLHNEFPQLSGRAEQREGASPHRR